MIVNLKLPTIHAVKIVKYIAEHQNETLIAQDISKAVDLTSSYFMRIVKDLRKAGILESVQGRNGGFILSRPAEGITLYDIVEAIEEEGRKPSLEEGNKLFYVIEKVNEDVRKSLSAICVSEL